jgi:hypothetical protein
MSKGRIADDVASYRLFNVTESSKEAIEQWRLLCLASVERFTSSFIWQKDSFQLFARSFDEEPGKDYQSFKL